MESSQANIIDDTPRHYGSAACVDPRSELWAHQVPGGLLFRTSGKGVGEPGNFVPCDPHQANLYLRQIKLWRLRIITPLPIRESSLLAFFAKDCAGRPHFVAPDGQEPETTAVAAEIPEAILRRGHRTSWALWHTMAMSRVGPLRGGSPPPKNSVGQEFQFRDIDCPEETTRRLPPSELATWRMELPLGELWSIP